jgi:hypothetical protein
LPKQAQQALPVNQPVQIALNFQAISKTTNREKQFYVISIKKHWYELKDLSNFIHKSDEAEWLQRTALWNTRSNQNNSRNTVSHFYALNITRKVRTLLLTAGRLNITRHLVQKQTIPHSFVCF